MQNQECNPFVKRVLMLLAAQVSRLELELEMSVKERDAITESAQHKLVFVITASMWFMGIVSIYLMIATP